MTRLKLPYMIQLCNILYRIIKKSYNRDTTITNNIFIIDLEV